MGRGVRSWTMLCKHGHHFYQLSNLMRRRIDGKPTDLHRIKCERDTPPCAGDCGLKVHNA